MRAELTVTAKKPLPANRPVALQSHFNNITNIRVALDKTEFKSKYNEYMDVFEYALLGYQRVFLVAKPTGRKFKVHLENTNTKRTLRLLRQTIEELATDLEEYLQESDNSVESLKIAVWVEEEDAQSGQKLYWRDKLKKQATEDWMSKTYIPVATLVVAFSADYLLKGTQQWLNVPQISLTAGAAIVALVLYVIIKVAFYTDDYVYKDSG